MSFNLSREYVNLKRMETAIEEYILEDLYDRKQMRK